MIDKRQKAAKVKYKRGESITKQAIFVEYGRLLKHLSFAGAYSKMNTTLLPKSTRRNVKLNKFAFGAQDCRIYCVNIDLRHQYGIPVAESQTFLLAKRPSAAMREEKRLPLAG